MAMMRESSFMPTIKCSQCGRQVEISMMGDHICGGPGGEPSPPDMSNSFESYNEPPPDKYARIAPPRVDTTAANRTYMRQGQLTPVSSSSGSRSISPKTPDGRPGAGRGEDYFAPKIADDYESTPPQARRPGGYGGFADQDGFNNQMYPQNSPKKQAPSLLQRMNTIAPGPFEAGRRPMGSGRNAFAKNSSDENTMDSYSRAGYSIDRPGTATSNRSGTSSSSNPGLASAPRMPRTNGYGGFGPPGSNDDFEPEPPFGGMNRAGTFPRPSDPVEAPMRAPSAPGPRPDRFRRPSNASSNGGGRRPSFGAGPDTTRPPPPRTSLVRPTTSGKGSGNINLAAEFGIGNPYHTPSDSISSSISAYSSTPSQTSSRSSPDRVRPTKDRADTSGFDSLMNDLMYGMDAKNLPPTPKQPPPFEKPSSSLRSRDRRPADIAVQPTPQGRSERQRSPLMTPRYDMPIDNDRRNPYGGFETRENRYGASPQQRSTSPQGRRRNGSVPPPSSRGFCRACGEGIKGKSISSADGRLTGRYHKACFNCTTCREPFASSTFYVHGDQPYCELHYHKLNGSLCATCGRGIEGQYLEDEDRVKYHVGCFRCADCGMSLSNGYFEVDGKSYCEKDAWRRSQDMGVSNGPAGNGPAGTEVDLRMGGMSGRGTPSPMSAGLPAPGRPGSRKGSFSSLSGGGNTNGTPGGPMVPGLPRGQKLAPGMGPTPRPRMNKRMTRLGMM